MTKRPDDTQSELETSGPEYEEAEKAEARWRLRVDGPGHPKCRRLHDDGPVEPRTGPDLSNGCLPPPTGVGTDESWRVQHLPASQHLPKQYRHSKRPFWLEASAFESDRIAIEAGLPIEHVERLKEMMKEDDPRREFRSQLRNRRRAPGESLDSVYQD